jgi:hypothetical protein
MGWSFKTVDTDRNNGSLWSTHNSRSRDNDKDTKKKEAFAAKKAKQDKARKAERDAHNSKNPPKGSWFSLW